jgi:hypothetical protein
MATFFIRLLKYKVLSFLGIFWIFFLSAQTTAIKKQPATMSIAGQYSYGKDIEKGRVGLVYIYAKTDSTILFYLDLNRGAPSYNMGSIWGEAVVKKGKAIFSVSIEGNKRSCSFSLMFKEDRVIIQTINDQDDCGFGFGVLPDGNFIRRSKKQPQYFIDATGKKIYFKDLLP